MIGIAEGTKLKNRVCSLMNRFEGYGRSVMETMFKQLFFNQRFQAPLEEMIQKFLLLLP